MLLASNIGALRAAIAGRERKPIRIEGARPAAVLVPIVADPTGLQLLCFERTHTVLEHKGEICFPGGSVDPGDAGIIEAALRETHEELGIDAALVDVLGLLDDVQTSVSNYVITPVAGFIAKRPPIVPDAREVARPIWVPVGELIERGAQTYEAVGRDGATRRIYSYRAGSDRIWGATARIIHGMLSVWLDAIGER